MISIVIPAYRCRRDLDLLLGDVARSALPEREIVVVDDGSGDDTTAGAAATPGARVVTLPENRGPAHARNVGALEARGDVLIFIDADVRLPSDRDVLAEMAAGFDDPEVDCVSTVSDVQPTLPSAIAYAGSVYHAYYMDRFFAGREEVKDRIMFFTTRLGAIRAAKFREAGGYYESLWTVMNEDGEFGARIYHLGFRSLFRRRLTHLHRFPTTWWRWVKSYFLTAMVQAQVDRKYDTSADESVSDAEKFRRLWAAAAFLLPLLPAWTCGVWLAGFALGLAPLHRYVWRDVPARYRLQWYLLYVLITPAILGGYAWGLLGHLAGRSLLRGTPSSLAGLRA